MCRNPTSTTSGDAVWCYTTDPWTRWEYCSVPYCREDNGNTGVNAEKKAGNKTNNHVTHETYFITVGSVASVLVLILIIVLVACILRSRRKDRNPVEPDLNPVYGAYDSVDYTVAEVEDTSLHYTKHHYFTIHYKKTSLNYA